MPTEPTCRHSGAEPNRDQWACSDEEIAWDPDAKAWAWRSDLGPYRACVPVNIAALAPRLDPRVGGEAAEAAVEMARFDAECASWISGGAPALVLVAEATSSSRIEHIRADMADVATATLGEQTNVAADLVASNVAATLHALGVGEHTEVDDMIAVQETLLAGSAPHHVGQFRQGPVWVGRMGSTPHSATFVAPCPTRVPALMDDLVEFVRRTDIAPFVQAAIAHAQFETIHPFPDGNGRTGRALLHGWLRGAHVTRTMITPISAGLATNVEAYFEALAAYRSGDLDRYVGDVAAATFVAVDNARAMLADVEEAVQGWHEQVSARRDAVVWRALPMVAAQPVVSIKWLAAKTNVSLPAAQRAIEQMEDADILRPVGTRKRSRTWVATDVTAALDDFARRSSGQWSGTRSL